MTFRDVKVIPLLGEMSQSDKRVAVFAEKPSLTDIDETLCFYLLGSHTGLPLQCNISRFIYTVGATLCGRPKRYRYINKKSANKPFQTTRTITNPERSDH